MILFYFQVVVSMGQTASATVSSSQGTLLWPTLQKTLNTPYKAQHYHCEEEEGKKKYCPLLLESRPRSCDPGNKCLIKTLD